MKTNNNIQEQIDSTLGSINAIENVNLSPFFKDKTMQRLFSEKEEIKTAWGWFSPKLQLATLACVVVLNVVAFTHLEETTYDDSINEFAETYGLSATDDAFILY